MAVKDKLELERLLSILEDLERMYQNGEIREETYREMKKSYKSRITTLQDRIMDMEQPVAEAVDDAREALGQASAMMTQNVNDLLKNTMRLLKEQLKTAGIEGTARKYKADEVIRLPLEDLSHPFMVKCCVEKGTISVVPGMGSEVVCTVEKAVKDMLGEELARKKLDRIDLSYSTYMHDTVRVMKLSPSGPPSTSVAITVAIPPGLSADYELVVEHGSATMEHVAFGTATLKTENGSIEMRDCTGGQASLDTETGSITLERDAIEHCTLETENGNIKAVDARGLTFEARTEKGNITAYESYASSTLETELGSIKFRPDNDQHSCTLSSELGSIKIIVPDPTDPWHIRAYVERGAIRNDTPLERRMQGDNTILSSPAYRGGGIDISATTELGSIRICGINDEC